MRDHKTITPQEAKAAGYLSFEAVRRAQTKGVKVLNADGEKFAAAKGWRIVGKWDDSTASEDQSTFRRSTTHRRTFWCVED